MERIFNYRNMSVILDYISDGVQVIDQEGRLIYCNRRAAVLDDINIENSIGKHILDIYPSLTVETSTLLKVVKGGHPILNHEQSYTTYKGNLVTTVNSTLPIRVGKEILGAIEVSHNITEFKMLSERVVDLQNKVYGGKAKLSEESAVYCFDDIVTNSDEMNHLKAIAMRIALADIPILVHGDTGTGKELVVQSIHNASLRRKKAFIAQNCAAIPATLLEGILFGTVKGSFTGATDRPGLLELADGGTLFLDEINSMPLELQGKFLRVLQDGKVRRVGDTKTRSVDVRIIAAMNIDPQLGVEEGHIRKDLYFRLNTVTLSIPKLSERPEDIMLLARHFVARFNDRLYLDVKGFSREVEKLFMNYPWPGNVRELEHVIEGAMNLVDGRYITKDVLPKHLQQFETKSKLLFEDQNVTLSVALERAENEMIHKALKATANNVTKAAEILGIPRQTLQSKIKKRNEIAQKIEDEETNIAE